MSLMILSQESAGSFIQAPNEVGVEQTIINLVLWLKLAVETTGAIVIGAGIVVVIFYLLRSLVRLNLNGYNEIRLTLSRYLALALEFQLGADILSTAIAPTWEQIGKLAAIAFIRTVLNYFLSREMKEESEGSTADSPIDDVKDNTATVNRTPERETK